MTKQEYLTAAAQHFKQSWLWFALNVNLLNEDDVKAGLKLIDDARALLCDAAWQVDVAKKDKTHPNIEH